MGAWGFGPFENDTAMDHVWDFTNKIDFNVVLDIIDHSIMNDKYDYENVRVDGKILVGLNNLRLFNSHIAIDNERILTMEKQNKLMFKLIKIYNEILNDNGYLESWSDSEALKKELTEELKELQCEYKKLELKLEQSKNFFNFFFDCSFFFVKTIYYFQFMLYNVV